MRQRWHWSLFASTSKGRTSGRDLAVVEDVELAFHPGSRLASALGFILGGVIPIATYLEAHCDLDPTQPLETQPAAFLVAGGLLFSAKTVFAWGKRAFRDGAKAAGFVLLLEGVMITSAVPVLPLVLLAILVAINGIATGCALSLDRSPKAGAAPRAMAVAATVPERQGDASAASGSDGEPVTGIVTVTRAPRRRRANASQKFLAFVSPGTGT